MKLAFIEIALLAGAVQAQADFNAYAQTGDNSQGFMEDHDYRQWASTYHPGMSHEQHMHPYGDRAYHDYGYELRAPHSAHYRYSNQMAPVFGGSEEAPNYLPDTGKMFEPIKIDDYKPPEKAQEAPKRKSVFGAPIEVQVPSQPKPAPQPTPR